MSENDERESDVHLVILDRLDIGRDSRTVAFRGPARLRAAAAALARTGEAAWARTAETVAAGAARSVAPVRAARRAIAGASRSARSAPARIRGRLAKMSDVAQSALLFFYGGGVVVLFVAAVLGWLESPRNEPPALAHPVTAEADGDRFVHASDVLRDPSIAEEAKLSVLENVATDPRESATKLLLSAAGSDSLLVSMAGIRALRGRPCDRVQALLTRRLAHDDWRRRAWAAKVLGENGCADAVADLKSRLAHERDDRVRREISTALTTLERGAG